MPDQIIEFIRRRDYRLEKELGRGACGRTVLLHDDLIDEKFVCKKYTPYSEEHREELFANFKREIKLLHQIYHQNIVRVFNYYLYPAEHAGFLLMEFVKGTDLFDFIENNPEQINEVFLQAIEGFRHLESNNILHRDIRPQNIMVRDDGVLKIIDLGFGKRIQNSQDFDKSISLNWWCETPNEFSESTYDFSTEVYFVGKLFEQVIHDFAIDSFQYKEVLARMCQRNPATRMKSFFDIEKEIQSKRFFEVDFSAKEMSDYRYFADQIQQHISKIERGSKYRDDPERLQIELENVYRRCMLEETVPDAGILTVCFIIGTHFLTRKGFPVDALKSFVHLLKSSPPERKRIILSNLHTRLDAVPRYTVPDENDDDIPF